MEITGRKSQFMRTQWSVLRVVAAATIFFAGPIRAQTGAVPVDLQARILDLTSTPPAAPKDISEPFDAVSGTGLKLVFDLDYGNVVLYTTNPNSQLLKSFGVPGFSGDAGSVHYPWTSYYFYSSINKLNNSSGFLAGSLLVN